MKDEKATNANAAGTNEGDKDSNNVDSELKLQELGYAVVDVATPHDSLDDAGEVVVRQDDVWCLLGHICSWDSLNWKRQRLCARWGNNDGKSTFESLLFSSRTVMSASLGHKEESAQTADHPVTTTASEATISFPDKWSFLTRLLSHGFFSPNNWVMKSGFVWTVWVVWDGSLIQNELTAHLAVLCRPLFLFTPSPLIAYFNTHSWLYFNTHLWPCISTHTLDCVFHPPLLILCFNTHSWLYFNTHSWLCISTHTLDSVSTPTFDCVFHHTLLTVCFSTYSWLYISTHTFDCNSTPTLECVYFNAHSWLCISTHTLDCVISALAQPTGNRNLRLKTRRSELN